MVEPAERSAIKYRPDIDGLRAVAVLAVLAFHVGSNHIPGGFIGVDVFFVISGYLISAIVFSEIAASRFSVLAFYERRVRRIFPALFAMLIVFSAMAYFLLLPTEFVDYSKSLLSAITSSSNFFFWRSAGYFDFPTSHPLLHTWSLAVEEQFYIFFPLFLVIVRRLIPGQLRRAVIVLFFASLLTSVVTVHYSPDAAFYLPTTRAWELLLGTLLSLGIFPRIHSLALRNLSTLAGMALILYPAFRYSELTAFPGLAALPPCFGSALIIAAGESGSSLVGRALAWRPIAFIGLISYSLYLWQWPVVVLHSLGLSFNPQPLLPALLAPYRFDKFFEIALSFLLAILSWRFVEQPFRKGPLRLPRRPLFLLSAAVMASLAVFAVLVIAQAGFSSRFPQHAVEIASYLANPERDVGQAGQCFLTQANRPQDFDKSRCLRLEEGKKNYLVVGDSHAVMLWNGLSAALPQDHFLLASAANCESFQYARADSLCSSLMRQVFQEFIPKMHIDGLYLQAAWTPKDMPGLTAAIQWAQSRGLPVTVFGPVPEYDAPLPRLLAYSISWHQPNLAAAHRLSLPSSTDALMQNMAANVWHIPYISLYQAICPNGRCRQFADPAQSVPMLFDTNHLSPAGSALIVRQLAQAGALQ
jgi:peptidoglycan/LPS O-acetylase OafA/YrhL